MNDRTELELELHAYVDGDLDDEGMARVEEYLRHHPEAARRVWEYLKQKDDIRRFASREVESDQAPAAYRLGKQLAKRLEPKPKIPGGRKRILALAFVFVAGWLGHSVYAPLASGPQFTSELVQAHWLSTSDPTEIPPLSPERVTKMFSRIGEAENLPNLRAFGFEPMGAQLLPSDEGLVLHIPYRRGDGSILSYFLLHRDQEAEVEPHLLKRDGVNVVYWQHDHARHALAGALPQDQISQLADTIDHPLQNF